MKRYKVVEQKTKSFVKGKMTAQDLENKINEVAQEGWTLDRVIAGETARVMGISSDKDVFLLIFQQEG
ncbi:MAG: DUF4177 domain-containing protein [Pseudomonadales bacterium]|nr:DUF4177 domain-containing protein [Pseudomonadales bacterium]